jgi:hypothetical protein
MTLVRCVPALLIAAAAVAGDAPPAAEQGLKPEPVVIGETNQQIPVSSKKDITLPLAADPDAASRELYFRLHDGTAWGAWQKHGQAFTKDAPVTWSPVEGHQQIYINKILTSGAQNGAPTAASKALTEFIIDRTAPTVGITFPGAKAKLRGGDRYTVTWKAEDKWLRSTPITVKFSRDGNGTYETLATGLPNSGSWEWTVPMSMTTSGVLKIEAADKAVNVGAAEVSGLIIDSIKPRGAVTGPAISARAATALDLDVSDQGPATLTAARLWISQDDGTSWTEGPVIEAPFKQVAWTAPADGRFRLYVVGTDGAGNITAAPKGKENSAVLIVDATAPSVILTAAIGIANATGGAGARVDFKAGDRVQVPFTIKDANLVSGSATISIQYDSSKGWVELGRNQPTDAAFFFAIPADAPDTTQARVKVTAVDQAGNVGEAVSSQPFAIKTTVKTETLVQDPGSFLNP